MIKSSYFKNLLRLISIAGILFTLMGCVHHVLPPLKPPVPNTPLSHQADDMFWDSLHNGKYENIDQTLLLLKAADKETPNNSTINAHIAFLYAWSIAERQRNTEVDPQLLEKATLSQEYFTKAVAVNPDEPRYLGYEGLLTMVVGTIKNSKKLEFHGFSILQDAISEWPVFNYFLGGYGLSALTPNSLGFGVGLDAQWNVMEMCAGNFIKRSNPDFSRYMKRETQTGFQRACWNSSVAPHNFEGFFLNMGDMLVKSGDWETAIKIYKNARLSKTYNQWKYKDVLEDRILHAKENVKLFNVDSDVPIKTVPKEPAIMFNSKFSCVVCHEQ